LNFDVLSRLKQGQNRLKRLNYLKKSKISTKYL